MGIGASITGEIQREKTDREMRFRECNYLVISRVMHNVLRQATGMDQQGDLAYYEGMKVTILDRDDYTFLIG